MNVFEKIKFCPLCRSNKRSPAKISYRNLYSEMLSKNLNIEEKKLLRKLSNARCKNCKLVYKNIWFKDDYLVKIFSKLIPTHPKGWDTISNKFNKIYFKKKLKDFEIFFETNEEQFNKSKREIFSFVKSIRKEKNSRRIIKSFLDNILDNNFQFLKKNKNKIIKFIKKPKNFTRYSGFRSEHLFDYIESKIGNINTYSEIGCPLWGMLDYAVERKCFTTFYKPEAKCFWSNNCKKNKLKCIKKLNQKTKILKLNERNKNDFLGCFVYLDHLKKPLEFLKKRFSNSKSIGLILENIKNNANMSQGLAIQHFTGWDKKSINYLSKKLNKKFDCSFKEIQSEGYQFFLIY